LSQRLRDKPRVHGQGELGEIKTFAMKLSFQTCEGYPRKAGHSMVSMTYHYSLFALPRPGQLLNVG
jgi:hypothetical protein